MTITTNSSQQESISLTFCDLTHEVRFFKRTELSFKRERKCILKGVSGLFQSGELTAIIGPSGCGKTTLMDILTGYIELQNGSIHIDGENKPVKCSYIMQNDLMEPLLTVHETMKYASALKLRSKKLQENKVNEILSSFALLDQKNTYVSKLSGGEKRKLSLAIELINEPPIMFFDEPTSGLDSLSAEKCIETLKAVASRGVIVVCSVHQPSRSMMDNFDHIYVMADGMCTFQGTATRLIEYLHSLALTCPENYNPADHILEITLKEYGNNLSRLVAASENGANQKWRGNCRKVPAEGEMTTNCFSNERPLLSKKRVSNVSNLRRKYHKVPLITQFSVLTRRAATSLFREELMMSRRFLIHAIMGLFIGTMYFKIGNDAAYIHDNFSLLFYILMFLMFTSYSGVVITSSFKLRITTREYFNDWYSLKAFYLAESLVGMVFQILCSTTFCLIVYYMSGQPNDIFRFSLLALSYAMVSLISQTFGMFIGIIMRLKHGMIFGSGIIMPCVIFCGFFLRLQDAPWFSRWIFHINYLKYGFEGGLLSVYGYNRSRLACSQDYCHFVIPDKFLKHLDLQKIEYNNQLIVLSLIFILVKFITFKSLKYQLKNKRKKQDDED